MTNKADATIYETILEQEQKLWQCYALGDSAAFGRLVDPQALMIVGGERGSGADYAQAIAMVRLQGYELRDVVVLDLGPGAAAIHYSVTIKDYPGPYDLSGTYRVTSIWQRREGGWVLVLNQDVVARTAPG